MKKTIITNTLKHNHSLILLIIISLLAIVFFRYLSLDHNPTQIYQVKSPRSGAHLTFSPSSLDLVVNQERTVTLLIKNETLKVTGVTIELNYDPQKITLISITPNNYFPNVLSHPINNLGTSTFTYTIHPDQAGQSGSASIAIIKFKPIAQGNTKLTLGSSTAISAIDSDTNVLDSVEPLILNIIDPLPSSPSKSPEISTVPPVIEKNSPQPSIATIIESNSTNMYEPEKLNFFERLVAFIKNLFDPL